MQNFYFQKTKNEKTHNLDKRIFTLCFPQNHSKLVFDKESNEHVLYPPVIIYSKEMEVGCR